MSQKCGKRLSKKSKDVNSEIYKAAYDSVYNKAYAKNLKDVGQEEVYLWYTYNQVREKQIGLGLDLKGGMTVTLQINVADIVRAKATNPLDAKLNEALEYASKNPGNDFVGAFAKKYEELVPGVRLSQKFNTVEGVNANDDNARDVKDVLRGNHLLEGESRSRDGLLVPPFPALRVVRVPIGVLLPDVGISLRVVNPVRCRVVFPKKVSLRLDEQVQFVIRHEDVHILRDLAGVVVHVPSPEHLEPWFLGKNFLKV